MLVKKLSALEKVLLVSAWTIYSISVAVLTLTLFFSTGIFPSTLLLGISLYTPPLTFSAIVAGVALTMYYGKTARMKLSLLFALSFFPVILCFMMPDASYVVFSSASIFVIALALRFAKLLPIRWHGFVLLGLMAAVVGFFALRFRSIYYNNVPWHDLIAVFLSRGKSDPEGLGYERLMMDQVLTHAKVFGKCSLALDESRLPLFGRLIQILYNYGWNAFGALFLGYTGIISMLIFMSRKISMPELKAVSIASTVILTLVIACAYFEIGMGTAVRMAAPFLGYCLSQIVTVGLLLTVIILFIVDRRMKGNLAFASQQQSDT